MKECASYQGVKVQVVRHLLPGGCTEDWIVICIVVHFTLSSIMLRSQCM